MSDADPPDSSPSLAADPADPRGSEAFSVLGSETRLAILLALWEASDPFAEDTWDPTQGNTVSFSELRELVGLRDSGQFNYHLGQLEGLFVEQTEDGYQLLPAGNKVVRTIVSLAGFEDVSLEPTEIDIPCSLCNAPTAIAYKHQRLYHVCTECDGSIALGDKHPSGVLDGWIGLDPPAMTQRETEAIYTAAITKVFHLFAMRSGGICPWCSGEVETTLHVCDAHDPETNGTCPNCGRHSEWTSRTVCSVCKHTSQASLSELSLHHPAVISFYWEHGFELGVDDFETVTVHTNISEDANEDLVSRNPPRVRVTHSHQADGIQLTYDEELSVIEVTEPD